MKKQGFLLILSLIIISIVLSIGLGVFFIVIRELQLASAGRDSQIAFHAADSGIECARYWDVKKTAFGLLSPVSNITCAEQDFSVGGKVTEEFEMNLGNDSCARIKVDKGIIGITTIQSYGYNMPCGVGSDRKLERGIQLVY